MSGWRTLLIVTIASLFFAGCGRRKDQQSGPAADAAEWRRHNKGPADVLKNWRVPDLSQRDRGRQKQARQPNKQERHAK